MRIKEKGPPCVRVAASRILEGCAGGKGFFPLVLGLLNMFTVTGESNKRRQNWVFCALRNDVRGGRGWSFQKRGGR